MPDADSNPPDSLTPNKPNALLKWIKGFKKPTAPENGSAAIHETGENPAYDFITSHERILLSNILKLRELKVVNVMVPRANIVAVEVDTPPQELTALLAEKQYSRIPVYRDTLDDVLGTIHAKDVLGALARGEQPDIKKMITDIPIVSPAMTILNLLLKMRQSSRHMALVVDEYGGIDGLVTIGNVIEAIVGEIDDEHATDEVPQIAISDDGSVLADARLSVEEFDNRFGQVLTDEERNVSDTLSGLVFYLAGRIPARGEIITHHTGMLFEVVDAGPRRINLLRISNIPSLPAPK
jgi:magnesium and cobalt transporter